MKNTVNITEKIKNLIISSPLLLPVTLLLFSIFVLLPIYSGIKGVYLSNYGDSQQFIWQAKNLLNILKTGDTFVRDSFFGIAVPYAYTPIEILQAFVFLVFNKLSNNVIIAYNLSIGLFLFLNFISMYYVLKGFGRSNFSSLLFAFIFAFAPSTILHATGHISLFIVFTIPLFFLFLKKILYEPGFKSLFMLVLFYSLTFYIHEYYAVALTMIGVIFIIIYGKEILRVNTFKNLTLAAVSLVLSLLPIIKLYYDKSRFDKAYGIINSRKADEAFVFSSNPLNYVFPSQSNYLYENFSSYLYNHLIPSEQLNYFGIILLFLISLGFFLIVKNKIKITKKALWFYTISFIASLLLSFGPYMMVNGGRLLLPVALGFKFNITPFDSIRAYGRFGIIAFTVATLFGALIYDYLIQQKSYFKNSILLILLMGFSILDLYPIKGIVKTSLEVPPFVSTLSKETQNDSFILHTPFQHHGSSTNTNAMLYQVYHRKNIVNGYSSFESPMWEQKILQTSAKCFHYVYYTNPECEDLDRDKLQEDKIQFLIYEKNMIEPLPGYLSNMTNISEVRAEILNRFNRVIHEKVFEDNNFIVGKIY